MRRVSAMLEREERPFVGPTAVRHPSGRGARREGVANPAAHLRPTLDTGMLTAKRMQVGAATHRHRRRVDENVDPETLARAAPRSNKCALPNRRRTPDHREFNRVSRRGGRQAGSAPQRWLTVEIGQVFIDASAGLHQRLDQPTTGIPDNEKEHFMLYTIAVVLLIMWLLGLVTSYTLGGFIHILLVIAIVMVLVNLISGRRSL
jgi:hypothetical protein